MIDHASRARSIKVYAAEHKKFLLSFPELETTQPSIEI